MFFQRFIALQLNGGAFYDRWTKDADNETSEEGVWVYSNRKADRAVEGHSPKLLQEK